MNVLLLYGGKSCEHDVSIVTAKQVLANVEENIFEIYVTKNGEWRLIEGLEKPRDFACEQKVERMKKVCILPGQKSLYIKKGKKLKKLCDADVALLCFHGVNGEDGSVQGVLQLSDIPYTSCGICASSVAMDKSIAKLFLKGIGAPVVDGLTFFKEQSINEILAATEQIVGYPAIIKPSNLGSSIGISVSKNRRELLNSLEVAFSFDQKVLVEKALQNFEDANISVMKKDGQILTSLIEKPIVWHDFLSFDDKYKTGAKGMADSKRIFPFDHPQKEKIDFWAREIYKKLDCKGVVRIDFLTGRDGEVYVNEINTIPGSFAYYLWEGSFDFKQLLKIQIEQAINSQKQREKLTFLYETDLLKYKYSKK